MQDTNLGYSFEWIGQDSYAIPVELSHIVIKVLTHPSGIAHNGFLSNKGEVGIVGLKAEELQVHIFGLGENDKKQRKVITFAYGLGYG